MPEPLDPRTFRDPASWLSGQPVTLTVSGASMEPFLLEGDRVDVVSAGPSDMVAGDLLVFLRGDEVIVHRFLAAKKGRFLEKGDAQGKGNWAPWPGGFGRAVALWRGQERLGLERPPWPRQMAALGRTHLRGHRLNELAQALPGSFTRRIFLGLCRRTGLLPG